MSGSALFLSSSKLCHLFHSSFPNPFLPTDFQILLPSHYLTFPPPCPPSWTPYQHFLHFDINIHIKQLLTWCWSTSRKHRREYPLRFIYSLTKIQLCRRLQVKFQRKSCQVLGFDKFSTDKYLHHFQSYTKNLF